MEYCDEGTLEEVSRLGLQEHVIRLYSKQITVAINVLHEHGIVHRDIKGNPHTRLAAVGPRLIWCVVHSRYSQGACSHSRASLLREKSRYCKSSSIQNPVLRNYRAHVSLQEWVGLLCLSVQHCV